MTPDTSKACKLIDEAVLLLDLHNCSDDDDEKHFEAKSKLNEALTLLPSWQEFDPKREETWPKEPAYYAVTVRYPDCDPDVIAFWWDNTGWCGDNCDVLAYQLLPPPYARP